MSNDRVLRPVILGLLLGLFPSPGSTSVEFARHVSGDRGAPGDEPLPPLEEYHVRVFGPDDGLPVSEVRDLAQGPEGHIYLATARGLSVYNGYEFRRVALPGFRSRALVAIRADAAGRIWLTSDEGDVGYVDERELRYVTRLPAEAGQIHETPDGAIWLSGRVGLVRVLPYEPPVVTRYSGSGALPAGHALGPYTTVGDDPVVVVADRLFRLQHDPVSRHVRFTRFGPALSDLPSRPFRRDSVAIRLYLETMARGDSLSGSADLGPTEVILGGLRRDGYVVQHELSTPNGTRWFSLYHSGREGSILLKREGGRTARVRLRDQLDFGEITRVFRDHEGSVWVGTDLGLIQLVRRRVRALTERHGLAESFTVPVLQTADGAVWVGTWGGGLHRFAAGGLTHRFTTGDGLPANRVRGLYATGNGDLWVGTERGAARVRDLRVEPAHSATGKIRDFARTPDGRFWAAGVSTLYLLRDGRFVDYRPDVFANRGIWALHAADDGALWVGSEEGLFRLRGDSIRSFGREDGLRSTFIASIHEEDDGTLWFGTYADGLHRYRGGPFAPVTRREGLHHDGVWSMLPDGLGGIWMSSDGGVFRIDHRRLHRVADAVARGERPDERLSPLVFTEAEGMPTRECNRAAPGGWRLRDGRLVFNNLHGAVIIDPEGAVEPPPPPASEIVTVLADGRPVGTESDTTVDLPRGTRHFAFEFVALSFVAPGQNRYRYRLEGYDEDWLSAGTRNRAEYTNLAPGRYRFHVQAASGAGSWGEPAHHAFVLTPMPWETWWFRGLAFAAVVLALVVAYRYRVRHLLAMDRLRLRIAADLHDDVGSNLSSIALLSQILEEHASLEAKERRQLHRMHDAAEETIAALRDIIWLVDPANDQLEDLVRRMRKVAEAMLGDRDWTFEPPEADGRRPLSLALMRNAFLVYKEAVHNAAKHAPGSRVQISVAHRNGRLFFRVEDEGGGFTEAEITRKRGLENMRRRAVEVDGELDVESSPGGGTRITFSAPMA